MSRRKCLIRKVPQAGLRAGFLARSLLGETVEAFPDLAVNSKCIMLVGADPIRSRVLTRTLRRRDFQVASVRDGGAALRLAGVEEPAYVILDQDLPDRSGLALIRPLRSALPESRILVLAASPTIESAVDSIKLGACNYLAIPAGVDEILRGLGVDWRADSSNEDKARGGGVASLEDVEWNHILRALSTHEGNVSATARALRMNRRTLQRKLEAHEARTGRDVAAEIRTGSSRRRRAELRRQWAAARTTPKA